MLFRSAKYPDRDSRINEIAKDGFNDEYDYSIRNREYQIIQPENNNQTTMAEPYQAREETIGSVNNLNNLIDDIDGDLNEKLKQFFKDINPLEFSELIFNTTNKAVVSEVEHKLLNQGNLDLYFILWCLIIPNRKSLDDNVLKQLLGYNRIESLHYKLSFELLLEGVYTRCLSNLSAEQIRRIFSLNHSVDKYITSLMKLTKISQYRIKIAFPNNIQTIDELYEFTEEIFASLSENNYTLDQKRNYPKLADIDYKSTTTGLRVEVIKTYSELFSWSKALDHCIKSYAQRCHRGDYILLGVYKNKKKYANISIKRNFTIDQIKGKANNNLPQEEYSELINLLKENKIIL